MKRYKLFWMVIGLLYFTNCSQKEEGLEVKKTLETVKIKVNVKEEKKVLHETIKTQTIEAQIIETQAILLSPVVSPQLVIASPDKYEVHREFVPTHIKNSTIEVVPH